MIRSIKSFDLKGQTILMRLDLNVPINDEKIEDDFDYIQEVKAIESLSIQEKELELIKKSLEKHAGKRKLAAKELGISERTLYRKIKQFDL